MRLLLGSAHLLQERLEGDEAVIVGGVAELLHQVLGEDVRCREVNASHFLSLASTKSLHRRTSTFFGATDEPSRTIQEIAGFIEIHSRDRGR